MPQSLRAALVVLMLALLLAPRLPLALRPARAATTTFSSSGGVTIGRGAANPYPSTISVSGFVMHVEVMLIGLSYHNVLTPMGCNWGLLDSMLVSPSGQHTILMSDVP